MSMSEMIFLERLGCVVHVLLGLWVLPCLCFGAPAGNNVGSHDKFLALPLAKGEAACARTLYRYGVPFVETAWHAPAGGSIQVEVGAEAKRIFLLGMTETQRPQAWSKASTYSARFFVGDKLGEIHLHYGDGSTQDFPLILGESVWWGLPFYQAHEPFPADAHLRSAFEQAVHLYPAAPVEDGNYIAVIEPKPIQLTSIEITDSPAKVGSVAIAGVTVESALGASIAGATSIPAGEFSPAFIKFLLEKPLRAAGVNEGASQQRLFELSKALYSTDSVFKQPILPQIPKAYSGPQVSFKGTAYASALQNAFYANVQDMLDKVDADGTYHTSTRDALSWAGDPRSAGGEFGTFRKGVGVYYGQSWSRDLGRSLQELTELGFLSRTTPTADFALLSARTWAENPSLKYHGEPLPPHWSRIINRPDFSAPFENDGHGLISLFIYKLWLRLPDHDAWLRAHWTDVKAAGDWIPWQFEHANTSGAANGVLFTTGESAAGKGYSVYPDSICMTSLDALAQMADSIGETKSATLWRDRAEKMRSAIPARYLIADPKYGQVWTLDSAGWPNQSTVLGPLIFLADYNGFAPEDDNPGWRPANEAAYQRLIDTYHPFGFYGWAMGYGQGFVTQAALLLDRMKDVTPMLNWTARATYDPQINSFVVPEGVQVDPTGRFIYRTGDHGNGVQEAEIVKALRIVIGVDDNQPGRIRVFPRMPYGWSEIGVEKYPLLFEQKGRRETAFIKYRLKRTTVQMDFEISSDKNLGPIAMRLGPFEKQPTNSEILVNGRVPENATVQHSGDSWWVEFKALVGPATGLVQK